jgi:hypothetical protein
MKTLTFDYTKKDGSKSERTLLVTKEPSDKYAGIDLSELEVDNALQFTLAYETLHEEFLEKARELQAKYDLKYAYRQFFESGMSNVIEI